MKFEQWEPVYERILDDFGFDRAADERARDVLASHWDGEPYDPGRLAVRGRTVAIVGAAPALGTEADLDAIRGADATFAASTAADALRDRGLAVDCHVTDLDGTPETARALAAAGTPVAVHAHGDNVAAVREHVPSMDRDHVVPTTQAAPRPPVANFGGFTDGDRAAFLADHLGAGRLVFAGWAFDDPSVGPTKRRKLDWAARLLRWLERRRGERFAVLDGRRSNVDASAFPL